MVICAGVKVLVVAPFWKVSAVKDGLRKSRPFTVKRFTVVALAQYGANIAPIRAMPDQLDQLHANPT
jgi:hypothetical protein